MEIRARYVLIGLFVLAAIFAGFGFVYWLNNTSGIGPRTTYRVAFDGSVSGLTVGSPVLFNGLTVGEVKNLALVPDKPGRVMATIAVDTDTPVKADTHVGLDFRGLTGTATVALAGGTADAKFPPGDEPPMLVADANSMKDMTTAARDVLGNIDTLISDNKKPITDAIANIDTFSKALGENSDKVDGIMKGLAKLAGAGGPENVVNYDLKAPTTFGTLPAIPTAQLAVATPSTVISVDSRNIIVQTADGEAPGFPSANWTDNVPQLVRTRLIEGFENAGYMKVGADDGTITPDYKLLIDIRRFRVSTEPTASGTVDLSAKLVNANGDVVDARIFSASVPDADVKDAATSIKAVGDAFEKVATDVIGWTMKAIDDAGNASPPPASDGMTTNSTTNSTSQ